jgi:menaquinone-dependent protoporphyrinogen IX oxidase
MKTIVVYYSNKGSNKFLAAKIALKLSCELEEIRPRLNIFLLFIMNINLGIRPLKTNISAYDRVILCGPIWMGKFIPLLRSFIKSYSDQIKSLVFVTCCGSTYKGKDDKFGHGLVFKEVKEILGERCTHCQAFPVGLVLPEDQREDPDAFMKTHLDKENFRGEIQEIFNGFIEKLAS